MDEMKTMPILKNLTFILGGARSGKSAYAEQRAQKCKDILVNTYGCNPANILTSAKGDTIQPFHSLLFSLYYFLFFLFLEDIKQILFFDFH